MVSRVLTERDKKRAELFTNNIFSSSTQISPQEFLASLLTEISDQPVIETDLISLVMAFSVKISDMSDNEYAQLVASKLPEPRVYDKDDFITSITAESGWELPVDTPGGMLSLTAKNIGSEDDPTYIGYFDPREEVAARMGAETIALQLAGIENIGMAFGFASSKSEPMVLDGIRRANELRQQQYNSYILDGGPDRDAVATAVNEGTEDGGWVSQQYESILHKIKYHGLSKPVADEMAHMLSNGKKVVLVDDVYSRGGTTNAIRALIREVMAEEYGIEDISDEQLPLVTVFREDFPGNADVAIPNLRYGAFIPVVKGELGQAA